METLLINEQFVSQFKYWRDGQIRVGMRFRNNLFESVCQFKPNQRPQAFELAWQLDQSGKEVVVTASPTQYTVWVNLKAADKSVLFPNRLGISPLLEPSSQPPVEVTLLQPVLSA